MTHLFDLFYIGHVLAEILLTKLSLNFLFVFSIYMLYTCICRPVKFYGPIDLTGSIPFSIIIAQTMFLDLID